MANQNYKKILEMPDSKEKFLKLELALMKLQHHGQPFFEAKQEYSRLFKEYGKNRFSSK